MEPAWLVRGTVLRMIVPTRGTMAPKKATTFLRLTLKAMYDRMIDPTQEMRPVGICKSIV